MRFQRLRTTETFLVEKRGRMLRRARRFGRPETYPVTFSLWAEVGCRTGMPSASAALAIVWDAVRQRPRIQIRTGTDVIQVRRPCLVREPAA